MAVITNCYTTAAGTFAIAMCDRCAESANSIVSSFTIPSREANNHGPFQCAISSDLDNHKSLFATMLARSIKTGLFETVERDMQPLWKKGDLVNIYQLSHSKGLILEGRATVSKPLDTAMDHYLVHFHRKDGKLGSYHFDCT